MSETDKLAIQTADFALKTHEQVEKQAKHVARLADVAGEQVRQASLAARLTDWAAARVSPRKRRHVKLDEFDQRVGELEARSGAILREQAELREQIPPAEAEYQRALSEWLRQGSTGERPRSPVREIEERIRDLADEHEAVQALIGEVLEEKTRWVERHRDGLVKDAQAAVREAEAGYRHAIERLVEAREELVAARLDELWARLYPEGSVASTPPNTPILGGIPKRLRSVIPGLTLPIAIADLRRLLEADVEFVAQMLTPAQRDALAALEGRPSIDGATWAGTPEHEEQIRREREEARERYKAMWGHYPA